MAVTRPVLSPPGKTIRSWYYLNLETAFHRKRESCFLARARGIRCPFDCLLRGFLITVVHWKTHGRPCTPVSMATNWRMARHCRRRIRRNAAGIPYSDSDVFCCYSKRAYSSSFLEKHGGSIPGAANRSVRRRGRSCIAACPSGAELSTTTPSRIRGVLDVSSLRFCLRTLRVRLLCPVGE